MNSPPQHGPVMKRAEIEEYLPHREPFLLLDRVLELERDHRIVAEMDVLPDQPWFAGHFPHNPILPGVLIIEAMAQAGGVLALWSDGLKRETAAYFLSIDHARFRKPVLPNQTLRLELSLLRRRGRLLRFYGKAFVAEELVAEAQLQALGGTRL